MGMEYQIVHKLHTPQHINSGSGRGHRQVDQGRVGKKGIRSVGMYLIIQSPYRSLGGTHWKTRLFYYLYFGLLVVRQLATIGRIAAAQWFSVAEVWSCTYFLILNLQPKMLKKKIRKIALVLVSDMIQIIGQNIWAYVYNFHFLKICYLASMLAKFIFNQIASKQFSLRKSFHSHLDMIIQDFCGPLRRSKAICLIINPNINKK